MALLSTDGLRAINQASRPSALDASRQTIEQTQPLGATAAPRAYEPRPKAAARKAHNSDADPVFDAVAIAEPISAVTASRLMSPFATKVDERARNRATGGRRGGPCFGSFDSGSRALFPGHGFRSRGPALRVFAL